MKKPQKSDCGSMVTVYYDDGNKQGLLIECERDEGYCQVFFFPNILRTESKEQILSIDHKVIPNKWRQK